MSPGHHDVLASVRFPSCSRRCTAASSQSAPASIAVQFAARSKASSLRSNSVVAHSPSRSSHANMVLTVRFVNVMLRCARIPHRPRNFLLLLSDIWMPSSVSSNSCVLDSPSSCIFPSRRVASSDLSKLMKFSVAANLLNFFLSTSSCMFASSSCPIFREESPDLPELSSRARL